MDDLSTKYRKWALEYLTTQYMMPGCPGNYLDQTDEIVEWLRAVGFEDGSWVLGKVKYTDDHNRMTEARNLLDYIRSGIHYTPVREEN